MISSLVVETTPERTDAIARALALLEGVEVHDVVGANIAITIEAENVDAGYAQATQIPAIEGVVGAQLIYANFEDE